jgi:soluble lytic murein transglycosylase-like protein
MIPTGMSAVMTRIARFEAMIRHTGGFAGALGSALAVTEAPAPSAAPVAAPAPPPPLSDGLPPGAARWQASIERAAANAGIDPRLLTAVVWVESGFQPDAVSHAGAIGLAQLMPGTAEGLGVDPYDPEQNLAGGARFLKEMIDRFGRVDLALAAYNAGPARVASLHDGGPGVPVSQDYVNAVLDRYELLGGTT